MPSVLKRTNTAEAVVNYFKEQISGGSLKPGDKLPSERLLQQQFGISRFALREGLARLSALGIVRIVHGKGAFVTEGVSSTSLGNVLIPAMAGAPDQNLRDLFEARLLIETEMARQAARRHTRSDTDTLHEILQRTESALDNAVQFSELDYEFHQAVARAAGNVFLRKMLDVLSEHVRTFLDKHARSPASRKAALQTHRELADHISAGSADKAADTMARHLRGCRSNYETRSKEG